MTYLKKAVSVLLVLLMVSVSVGPAFADTVPNSEILSTYQKLIQGHWEVKSKSAYYLKAMGFSFEGKNCILTVSATGEVYITVDPYSADATGILTFNADGSIMVIYVEGVGVTVYYKK